MTSIDHPHILVSPNEWVPLRKLAAITGLSSWCLKRWAAQGKIPSLRSPGGHRRFRVGPCIAAIDKMTEHATPDPTEGERGHSNNKSPG